MGDYKSTSGHFIITGDKLVCTWEFPTWLRIIAGVLLVVFLVLFASMLVANKGIDGRIVSVPFALVAVFLAFWHKKVMVNKTTQQVVQQSRLLVPFSQKHWQLNTFSRVEVQYIDASSTFADTGGGVAFRPAVYYVSLVLASGQAVDVDADTELYTIKHRAQKAAEFTGLVFDPERKPVIRPKGK